MKARALLLTMAISLTAMKVSAMTAYPYLALPTDCSGVLEYAGMELMLDAMATAMASRMV